MKMICKFLFEVLVGAITALAFLTAACTWTTQIHSHFTGGLVLIISLFAGSVIGVNAGEKFAE
jgi:hypothetical protein